MRITPKIRDSIARSVRDQTRIALKFANSAYGELLDSLPVARLLLNSLKLSKLDTSFIVAGEIEVATEAARIKTLESIYETVKDRITPAQWETVQKRSEQCIMYIPTERNPLDYVRIDYIDVREPDTRIACRGLLTKYREELGGSIVTTMLKAVYVEAEASRGGYALPAILISKNNLETLGGASEEFMEELGSGAERVEAVQGMCNTIQRRLQNWELTTLAKLKADEYIWPMVNGDENINSMLAHQEAHEEAQREGRRQEKIAQEARLKQEREDKALARKQQLADIKSGKLQVTVVENTDPKPDVAQAAQDVSFIKALNRFDKVKQNDLKNKNN